MYVRNWMTANPYVISPESTVTDIFELMRNKKISIVPVVKNGKLVGIITEKRLLEVSPSAATSLSIFEINYLLSKTKIESIMTKNPICVSSDNLLEEAAVKMRDNHLSELTVVDDGKLVGIITETEVFDSLISIMGFRDKGSRIAIEVEQDKPGVLAQISSIIAGFDVNITHIVVFGNEIIIRINTLNIDDIRETIQKNGFKIISINRNE